MKAVRHIAVIGTALFLMLGLPTAMYVDISALFQAEEKPN